VVTPSSDVPWFAQQLVQRAGRFRAALMRVNAIHSIAPELDAVQHRHGEQRSVNEVPSHAIQAIRAS
jgi:hypothetical protein